MRFLFALSCLLLASAAASAQPASEEAGPTEAAEDAESATAQDEAESAHAVPEAPAASDAPSGPADIVVVLSVGGDASDEDARLAREAVAAALRAEGMQILPDADVALTISPSRLSSCRRSSCAYAIGRELEVSMVAAVARWTDDGGSLSVSLITGAHRSHSATEPLADTDVTSAARAAVASTLAARRRAFLMEGAAVRFEPDDEDDATSEIEDESALNRDRSLEEWILPSLLTVVGLGLVGLSVYAMLDEMCDVQGRSGECLAGSRPNYGLGVATSISGGLSIVGGIIWLIVGGQANPSFGEMDVVFGPDGGGASFRGTF